jgi:SAM-dependent methyltransferase
MHYTAQKNAERFFQTYVYGKNEKIKIVETGAQIGGFNIRTLAKENMEYIGIDIDKYPGVDIKLEDPYKFPFDDNSVDFVISSSCFEHIEFFWLTYLEIMRILKPNGLFYLNAPSNGDFHRFPVDCWRFYPDSGKALINWGKRNGYNCNVVEQYTSDKDRDIWADYVSIFIKDENYVSEYPNRITTTFKEYINGTVYPNNKLTNQKTWNGNIY